MRKTTLALVGVMLCGLALLVLWPKVHKKAEAQAVEAYTPTTKESVKARLEKMRAEHSQQGTEPESSALTDHAKEAYEKCNEFAKVANLYKYDPTLVGFREEAGNNILLETKSHVFNYRNGKVTQAVSVLDSNNPPHDREGKGRASWYQCTGKMSEKEAIERAYAILQALGETEVIEAVKSGKTEVRAESVRVQDPNGNTVRLSPFVFVDMYDRPDTEVKRAAVEFRMGPEGVAGVTRWICP